MIFLELIIIGLLTVVLFQRQIKLSTLKRIEGKMASQEARLKDLLDKVAKIQAGVDKLQQEFEEFKENNPELEDELAGLESAIGALDADVNPAAPEPTPEPTPEPNPEG